jgi:hypothetical protein
MQPALALVLLVGQPLLAGNAAAHQADFRYAAQVEGDMQAWLEGRVADTDDTPGIAAVTLTVHVEGGPCLHTQPVQVSDTTGAWKITARSSAWTTTTATTVSETIQLRQLRPGPASLPALTVRFRQSSDAEWSRAQWSNILAEEDYVPPPEMIDLPSSPWLRWLPAAGFLAATGLLAGLLRKWRRRPQPLPVLSAEEQALQELASLEERGVPAEPDWSAAHTQLSDILRRYLAQRLGVAALEQSSTELLAAVGPHLPADSSVLPLLTQLLHHCDRAKFAPGAGSADSWQQMLLLARDLVAAVASLPPRP